MPDMAHYKVERETVMRIPDARKLPECDLDIQQHLRALMPTLLLLYPINLPCSLGLFSRQQKNRLTSEANFLAGLRFLLLFSPTRIFHGSKPSDLNTLTSRDISAAQFSKSINSDKQKMARIYKIVN